jgi:hypothetical protein
MSDELPALTITEVKTEKVDDSIPSNKRSASETHQGPITKRLKVSLNNHHFMIYIYNRIE